MLVKRDDKLIYSVQRSALLSGRAEGVQQQQKEAEGMRGKECERQRAGGSKSEGSWGWVHINDEFNLYANKLAALSTQTQRRRR